MTDITHLKRMLADRAQAVAEHLLPNGRKESQEWRAGSIDGEAGKSLGVHLGGAKAGVWADFGTGEGGDLVDLWCAVKRMSLTEALDDIRGWLGVENPRLHTPTGSFGAPKRSYTRPEKPKCTVPQAQVRDYLTEVRNVSGDALKAYQIGEQGKYIIFPFKLPDGTLALAKRREAVDGAKPMPTAADCEPVLFGWQAIPDNARELTIVEGEIDALSGFDYGRVTGSVPFGGGGGAKQQWIENDFERMERFERIYLATDDDEEGHKAAEEIASRLGRHRCYRVILPLKDMNACMQAGISKEEIDACYAKARSLDPDGLRRASDYTADVVALFWPKEGDKLGYETAYQELRGKLLFRPGEMTLWTGASGHGKSQILSDNVPAWIQQGARICMSSLEMKPKQTLKRCVKQTVGVDRPSEPAIITALQWLDQGLFLYDLTGKAKVEQLLEIFDYAHAKYGCDTFIIDSLMRMGIAADDFNTQETVVYRLVDWCIEKNVHLHLVAHARKGDRDRAGPADTEDIKGAMEVGANAFNIVSVWRNRKIEEELANAETDAQAREIAGRPNVIMNVAKQRNGDFEGKVPLWFDKETYQYRSFTESAMWRRSYVNMKENAA